MEYVQLIEKVIFEDGVWLTFWSVEEDARLSVEIGKPQVSYVIGDVFIIDREGKSEFELLKAVSDAKVLTSLKLILGPPNRVARRRLPKSTVTSKTQVSEGGSVRLLDGRHHFV